MTHMHRTIPLAALLIVAGLADPAHALVESIDATVTAEVTETVGGSTGDSDLAFENLDETTGNLPISAEAALFAVDDEGEDEAGATATAVFYDPRLSITADPNEFSLDVGAFSLAPGVSYNARSQSTETRQITFLAEEITGGADGAELEARSYFFVDGLLLVWGEIDQTDLTGTTASVTLKVVQTRPDAEPGTVLTATVTLTGQSNGTVDVATTGGLAAENISAINLTGDDDEFGPLFLVVIPATTALPYTYNAAVGETFSLEAEIEAEAVSQPGTGAAVQLGVPLLELAALVNAITGSTTGNLLQDLIGGAAGSADAARPLTGVDTSTTVKVIGRGAGLFGALMPACGAMGVEALAALTLFTAAVGVCRRRSC